MRLSTCKILAAIWAIVVIVTCCATHYHWPDVVVYAFLVLWTTVGLSATFAYVKWGW
jgi:hypothetical protein